MGTSVARETNGARRELPLDFIGHLGSKGALREDLQPETARTTSSKSDGAPGSIDWSAVTKLTPTALADELANFYQCGRVRRDDLVEGAFAGADL